MDEAWLIQECRQGNPKAQEVLYKQFASKMLGVCIRYASDRDTAQDMLQEGFIRVFTCLNDFAATGSFEGWMRRIFINCALERIRKEKWVQEPIESHQDYENSIPSALEELTTNELLELIRKLPDGYRTIFNLFAIEGFSHKEISDLLHITEGTSRSQYARARQTLQEMIKKMYSHGPQRPL